MLCRTAFAEQIDEVQERQRDEGQSSNYPASNDNFQYRAASKCTTTDTDENRNHEENTEYPEFCLGEREEGHI